MKIVIFEVCRSPEIKKITEPVILSQFFQEQGIDYELYSNDQIWSSPAIVNKGLISTCLAKAMFDIVHLAVHGDKNSLILKWSTDKEIGLRVPEDILTGSEILNMPEWRDKIIVSGACNSSHLAPFFLGAGAKAVIAPPIPVDWPNLGPFFCVFYAGLMQGQMLERVLNTAISKFPEYACYKNSSVSSCLN